MSDDAKVKSSYLQYLPANFQTQKTIGPTPGQPATTTLEPFMGRFLLAFERILSGGVVDPLVGMSIPAGIETMLDLIPKYFVPSSDNPEAEAPAGFLNWLAGWVALSLRGDWTEDQQRRFIQQMPELYRSRGTLACMQQMLDIFIDTGATIEEPPDVPHFFTVTYQVPGLGALSLYDRAVRAIIDQEKPAYTFYGLNMLVNPMKLPINVGVNSILGTAVSTSSSSQQSSLAPSSSQSPRPSSSQSLRSSSSQSPQSSQSSTMSSSSQQSSSSTVPPAPRSAPARRSSSSANR